MNYRFATIKAEETFNADATDPIDIEVVNPISELIIRFQPLTGAEANSDGHPMKCLSKVELVDGSDVLWSLSGPEAHALDWYSHLKERPNVMCYLPTTTMDMALHINFGRYLWDPELAFDPKKFVNPQLKITLDIDGGGMNNSQIITSVFAHLFDEKAVSPVGFLMSKEIKNYALDSATHEYTAMPTDYPYRKLLLRIQKYPAGTEYCFGNIKLSEDVDRKVPINHDIHEILHAITGQQRPYREWVIVAGGGTERQFHITPAYWPGLSIAHWEGSAISTYATIWEGDGGRARLFTSGVGGNYTALVEGWCPHGVIEIPFGFQDQMDDWYDVTKIGSLKLDLLSNAGMSSSESCQIFLQQLRRY